MINTNKKATIFYWIFTGLFAAFMMFSAIPDIIMVPEAVEMVHEGLGYPVYLIAFIGFAKTLGVIAILIPGYPRISEWAYAGFFFDLIGATYSMIAIGAPVSGWIFMLLPIVLWWLSYIYYHKRLKIKNAI